MNIIKYIAFLLFFFGLSTIVQGQRTIKVKIIDKTTGEVLIGATASCPDRKVYAISNNYGILQLNIQTKDSVKVVFNYVGYQPNEVYLIPSDSLYIISLKEQPTVIDSVFVTYRTSKSVAHGHLTITQMELKNTPVIFAEQDVLKTLQLMPGVVQNREGMSNFTVRGGSSDQNLMLIDGIPVYNINHMFGFVSVFNTEACNKVNFYKGGIPARYGGRLSSVVDMMLKEGTCDHLTGSIALGSLASRFTAEGPLDKSRSTFMIAGRRTLYDLIVAPITFMLYNRAVGYYYQDLSVKTNYALNPKNTIYLSTYYGADNFYNKEKYSVWVSKLGKGWNNVTTSVRWNNLTVPNVFSNVTVAYTRYRYTNYLEERENKELQYYRAYQNGIDDFFNRWDVSYYGFNHHQLNIGSSLSFRRHHLGTNILKGVGNNSNVENNKNNTELGLYLEDEMDYSWISANVGIRMDMAFVDSKEYQDIQPRANVTLFPKNKISFSLGYDRTAQYIFLVSSSNTSLPNDLWIPVGETLSPQKAEQYSLGSKYIADRYVITIEAFYKKMNHVVDYRDGVVVREQSNDWYELLTAGEGRSYGLEWLIEKTTGRINGWISYTYSRSLRKFSDINKGRTFPYTYDRPHSGNIFISMKFPDSQSLSASWFFSSGFLYTVPKNLYQLNGNVIVNVSERNNYRMPFFHHLDIAYNFLRSWKYGTSNFIFGIYNVYGKINPFLVRYRYKDIDDKYVDPYIEMIGMLTFMPYVALEYKFK